MTAVPEPRDDIREARMRETAALVTRASALTAHGRDLLIGALAGYSEPAVRRAFAAALGVAEASQGPADDPPPADLWTIWARDPARQWTVIRDVRGEGAFALAARYQDAALRDGLNAAYLPLPHYLVPWYCPRCDGLMATQRQEELCGACKETAA